MIGLALFLFLLGPLASHGERIAKRIYKPVDGSLGCFRRFNGTHQFGCSSGANGNVGVLHSIDSENDLVWLVEKGPHSPYVALVGPSAFNRKNMMQLKLSKKINGVVILNETNGEKPDQFSIDDKCPNRRSSFYSKHDEESHFCDVNPWNPESTEFLFEDWGFPIFFVQNVNTSSDLKSCYDKYNKPTLEGKPRDWPLCAVELKSQMIGAVDTPTCIRRGILDSYINPQPSSFCDPLGDKNVYATLLPTNSSEPIQNRSLIFVTTRLDSMSLFEDLTPGADSVVTSLAAVLSVADMIGQASRQSQPNFKDDVSNVVFALFNGEAFDYIGSSRAVYDMQRGVFPRPEQKGVSTPAPVRLEHVKYFLEVEQLASIISGQQYFLHSDPVSQKDPVVKQEVDILKNSLTQSAASAGVELANVDGGKPLPPSSFQSFLKGDDRIAGVVITNHQDSFKNRFYNSEYDTADAIGLTTNKENLVKNIAGVSSVIANTVYNLATGLNLPNSIKPNEALVGDILECFLVSNNCTLLRHLMSRNISGPPRPLYVGVSSADEDYRGSANTPTLFVREILSTKLGERLEGVNKSDCHAPAGDDIFYYSWVGDLPESKGECYRSTVKLTVAVSPAFVIDGYQWASGVYSTWSESRWQPFSVRYFLKGSYNYEVGIFSIGVTVLVLSTILAYFTSKRADILFSGRIAGTS